MTIDEAIEEINEFYCHPRKPPTVAQLDAMQLSMQALERVKRYKRLWDAWHLGPLPGETKE